MVPARGKCIVKTGLAIKTPSGTYGRVAPRSGLAAKHGIDTGAGVIDEDYRGEVGVILFNHSDADFPGESRTWTPGPIQNKYYLCVSAWTVPPVYLCMGAMSRTRYECAYMTGANTDAEKRHRQMHVSKMKMWWHAAELYSAWP